MSDSESDDDFALSSLKKKKRKQAATKKRNPKTAVVQPDRAPSSSIKKKRKHDDHQKKNGVSTKKVKTEGTPQKELKKMEKAERLQFAMQAFLWWNAEELPEGYQWRTMEHAGVSFPEPYLPHRIKMKYDGKEVELTPVQEEA